VRTILHLLPALALLAVADQPPAGAPGAKSAGAKSAAETVVYDIHDLVGRFDLETFPGPGRAAFRYDDRRRRDDPADRAALVVRAVASALGRAGREPLPAGAERVAVLNGTRLVVRASAARQAAVADVLRALRRVAGLRVSVKARLYEVDHALYRKVAGARRLSLNDLEKLEQQFLAGPAPKGESLWKLVGAQKAVLTGDEVTMDNGREAAVLSRHRAFLFPAPRQAGGPPAVLEGVAFLAAARVTSDGRYAWLRLTEKAAEVKGVSRTGVPGQKGREARADAPLLDRDVYAQDLVIPDGGSALVPVRYRPPSARARDRWWVLDVTPRIRIEEEEWEVVRATLAPVLRDVVADLLTNPRLKGLRDYYGTPGDKRLALLDSDAWAWPKGWQPPVQGFRVTPRDRTGPRLLGLRVDGSRWQEGQGGTITLTLINAGGAANGPAAGSCTLRYAARPAGKGMRVGLAEDPAP
jgi:hypothetical protein